MGYEAADRAAEWRKNWPLVLTAFVGMSLSTVAIHSTGLIIKPLADEFGWNRTQSTAGITLAVLLAIPLSPMVGALIDRFGGRRLAVPGTVLATLAIAGISLANGSQVQWLALWAAYGLVALLIKTTIWTAAVTATFTAARSLAISIILCGTAFSAIVVPPLMQTLTDNIGWREAYLILAAVWGVPTFLLTIFFMFDAHDRGKRKSDDLKTDVSPSELPGLSIGEAARSLTLWRIGLATLIMLLLGGSLVVHKVPLLTELGVSREKAALLASFYGMAAVVGKLVTGWMMERWDAGFVGSCTNAATAFALIFLLDPFRTPVTIVLSMMVVGYASGTKLQICVYLTGIYAGMRNYGKIFGVMASVVAVAGGVGPMIGSMIYDAFGSYQPMILAAIPASLFSALLILRLDKYPEWSRQLAPTGNTDVPTTQ